MLPPTSLSQHQRSVGLSVHPDFLAVVLCATVLPWRIFSPSDAECHRPIRAPRTQHRTPSITREFASTDVSTQGVASLDVNCQTDRIIYPFLRKGCFVFGLIPILAVENCAIHPLTATTTTTSSQTLEDADFARRLSSLKWRGPELHLNAAI
jgi:hypothetical protein